MISFLAGCGSSSPTLPHLTDIPNVDANQRIFFVNDDNLLSQSLNDSLQECLIENSGEDVSLSRTGRYIASRKRVFDKAKNKYVLDITTDLPKGILHSKAELHTLTVSEIQNPESDIRISKFNNTFYQLPWSSIDDGFFVLQSNTLIKVNPSGGQHPILSANSINRFKVSHSENYVFVYHDNTVSIYSSPKNTITGVYQLNSSSTPASIRCIAWSPSENKVAFSFGWRFAVVDVRTNGVIEYEQDKNVFALEWVDDNHLLFVKGMAKDESVNGGYFILSIFNFANNTSDILHDGMSQDPSIIEPKISPSRKLILFSEYDSYAGPRIKLMSLDGKQMNILCAGMHPVWGQTNLK
jgi:hypothetical protein